MIHARPIRTSQKYTIILEDGLLDIPRKSPPTTPKVKTNEILSNFRSRRPIVVRLILRTCVCTLMTHAAAPAPKASLCQAFALAEQVTLHFSQLMIEIQCCSFPDTSSHIRLESALAVQ